MKVGRGSPPRKGAEEIDMAAMYGQGKVSRIKKKRENFEVREVKKLRGLLPPLPSFKVCPL